MIILNRHIIVTGTVTYAIKGRDILRNKGFRVSIERNSTGLSRYGCGYAIVVDGNIEEATGILKKHGVKILDIKKEW